MKKYINPQIEALIVSTIDVINASGDPVQFSGQAMESGSGDVASLAEWLN